MKHQYYFTFGTGSPLARYYVRIEAEDELAARALMVCMFSQHWASVYRDQVPAGIELQVNRQSSIRLGTNREEPAQEIYDAAYTSGRVVCTDSRV